MSNRKANSLSSLCTNFICLYDQEEVELSLSDAARRLGVQKRRIYDVVHVLESIGVMVRKGRDRFKWIGLSSIPQALHDLKEPLLQNANDPPLACAVISLGQLTQRFIRILLQGDVDAISLEEVVVKLFGVPQNYGLTNKAKRLSDIANVLSSLNLIEKKFIGKNRQLAFRWLGFEGRQNIEMSAPLTASPLDEQQTKRTFGTEITNLHLSPRISPFSNDQKDQDEPIAEVAEFNRTTEQKLPLKKRLLDSTITTLESELMKPLKKRSCNVELTAMEGPCEDDQTSVPAADLADQNVGLESGASQLGAVIIDQRKPSGTKGKRERDEG